MKSRTTTKTVEITIYGCDLCDFESEFKDAVREHEAEQHLCLGKRPLAPRMYMYQFDLQASAQKWLEVLFSDCQEHDVHWEGPGWYTVHERSVRSRDDSCWDTLIYLKPYKESA